MKYSKHSIEIFLLLWLIINKSRSEFINAAKDHFCTKTSYAYVQNENTEEIKIEGKYCIDQFLDLNLSHKTWSRVKCVHVYILPFYRLLCKIFLASGSAWDKKSKR